MIIADTSASGFRPATGQGYDGVALLRAGGNLGTASLLYDGRALLTAAHVVVGQPAADLQVTFSTASGSYSRSAQKVLVHPQYSQDSTANDIALVWLSSQAPAAANRYGLYRAGDELGLPFEMLGYGATGSGLTGEQANTAGSLHKAVNSFDTSSAGLWPLLSSKPSWLPSQGSQLVADFDNGLALNDTLGRITASPNLGLGPSEGLLGPGDSGSPAFIDGLLAGIGSHTSASLGPQNGDIDEEANSSFGELAFWQRVGYYQSFIDQALRGEWSGAPTTPEQVATVVTEGNGAPTLAYFLVELSGLVDFESQSYSVDYATRDGTAKAGEDYIAQQGTLIFYPDDAAVAIAIEIISDWRAEPTETFYLDIFNPVGGSFLGDQVQLTAMRTILDNDWV